ncbi:MAG: 60S ribosomal export protein NMD3, partial [Candidatus Altiarchaeota archaeon]|nr:60S ribosomal export protein NMD3 [Candidatus Altiarchaeota archaeon]
MVELPCPLCGKPSNGVCPSCFLKKHPLKVVREVFRECECGLTFFKGRWFRDRYEMVSEIAAKSIVAPDDVKIHVKDVEFKEERGELFIKANLRGYYKGIGFEDTLNWSVRPEKTKCENCKRQGSGYYEAVLQIRGGGIELGLDPKQVASVDEVRGG